MYYVYILLDKDHKEHLTINCLGLSLLYRPYYIGKGHGTRVYAHSKVKNTRRKKDAITKKLLDEGYKYKDLFIKIPMKSEDIAYQMEADIIDEIGLDHLTNLKPGGKNGFSDYSRRGKSYYEIYGNRAEIVRKHISEANTGFKASEETKRKLSESHKKYYSKAENRIKHSNDLKGRKMPDGFGESISKRFKGIKFSQERRNKISNALKGIKRSDSAKYNASKARAKYKAIITINNKNYEVYRYTFYKLLDLYNIKHTTHTWNNFRNSDKNSIVIENIEIKFQFFTKSKLNDYRNREGVEYRQVVQALGNNLIRLD